MHRSTVYLISIVLAASCGACVLAPEGLKGERDQLDTSGSGYAGAYSERAWPPMPASPTWQDFLQRAFLANGEIEAAWQEWHAAVANVTRESTWPSTNLELGLDYMFSNENIKAWDRTTVTVGFDAMETLALPSKTRLRGEIALAEARVAGERFRAAKFALQRRFLETWIALAKLENETRIRGGALALLRLSAAGAERGAVLERNQQELLRARLEVAREEDAVLRLKSMCSQMCVDLHALIGAPADVAIQAPFELPAARVLNAADAEIFALAAQTNPRLLEFARTVEGRDDALALARTAWLPDIVPTAGFTGGVAQFVGVSLSLPTAVPAIRAAIEAAEADLARSRAVARQGLVDVRASITAELLALRDAERTVKFLKDVVVPLARRLGSSARTSYAGGMSSQREWFDAWRAELDADAALLEASAARETSLARLEEWIGVDIETLVQREGENHGS